MTTADLPTIPESKAEEDLKLQKDETKDGVELPSEEVTEQEAPRLSEEELQKINNYRIFCRPEAMLRWLEDVVNQVDPKLEVDDFIFSFRNGIAMCAFLSFYRPDLVDYAKCKDMEEDDRILFILSILQQLDWPNLFSIDDWKEVLNQYSYILMFMHLMKQFYDPGELYFDGTLAKLGGKKNSKKKWKERYFLLENGTLSYFNKKGVRGVIFHYCSYH
jgi:hypothetical protein